MTDQDREALAKILAEYPPERNPAHPPEWWNRGVRNVAGGVSSALVNALMFPGQYARGETGYVPGQMASDQPAATQWAPEMALNMAGVPGGRGGMGSGARLPMDEANRMARAAEQGYTVDAYKGMFPYDWNTTPVRNGRGDVVANADTTPVELTSINSPNAPYAGFFSSDPSVANRFAQTITSEGSVLPAKLKFDNPLVIDARGRHAADFQFESIGRERGTLDQVNAFKKAFAPDSKYDGVILKNTKDEGDVYVPRNPDQIRSRFAAFDPASKGSGSLLGSLAALLGGGAVSPHVGAD